MPGTRARNIPSSMEKRTAVVLLNLGGPDSLATVQPFLYNLFSDPDIFKFPLGFITQKWFARFVSKRRTPAARSAYAAIGGRSPLLENTRRQAEALQAALRPNGSHHVFICMRYWHPMSPEVVGRLKEARYENVVLLPLYPQYSLTTTGSSYNDFMRECARQDYHPVVSLIRHWYEQEDYQRAIVESIQVEAAKLPDSDPAHIELLFSAHGLPQKIVDRGDPYQKQIEATYEALRARLGWPLTTLCYQSRVGPLKWLQPYTDQVIRAKAKAGAKQILIYPIAFVSDHSETLYELGMEYRKLAHESGIAEYRVVPALNEHPLLIRALAHLTTNLVQVHETD